MPFGDKALAGRSMIAHLYNSDLQRRGSLEVVYNCKQPPKAAGSKTSSAASWPGIDPYPWQTDTSIADWFYDRNYKYPPDELGGPNAGGHCEQERQPAVERRAAARRLARRRGGEDARRNWLTGTPSTARRSSARVPGWSTAKGRVKAKGGAFDEDYVYTADDIRFTTKGPTLYAIALGWPKDGRLAGPFVGQAGRRKRQRHRRRQPAGLQGQARLEADGRRPGSHAARREAKPVHGGA